MVSDGDAHTDIQKMGCYFPAVSDSTECPKAVANTTFSTITPTRVPDSMVEPIPTGNHPAAASASTDATDDLSPPASTRSHVEQPPQNNTEFTFPIIENPEPISLFMAQTQGLDTHETPVDPTEPISDSDEALPLSSSPTSLEDHDVDVWLAAQLAQQAPHHIMMHETFGDDSVHHLGLAGFGGNTTH
ncbi:hypothetical protein CYMTET_27282 [Cymbomonas tetramitiformis]|uniref:Uncharacterized protein n=1 Tax=Cymbomonas tetramitiformis TaxID=36881 RepID=A0AAE0KX20_9CHLO|nr:hypothetical protein CYMTET_27282 [Cymbomonas tetramitiformis]